MATPTRDEYLKSHLRFAQAWATAEWETQYGRPQRARETAQAWVGVIELMVMGSSEGYARASSRPYQPPRIAVVPAAPGISLSEMGLNVIYLPAGSPFRFSQVHVAQVTELFDKLTITCVPGEQYTRERQQPDDRVIVTWSTQCAPLFDDGKYPVPFNAFLLSPDGAEAETSRVTTRIVAAFHTQAEAEAWVEARAAQLKAEHDRNHARQCRDKTCAKREHIYVLRYDD